MDGRGFLVDGLVDGFFLILQIEYFLWLRGWRYTPAPQAQDARSPAAARGPGRPESGVYLQLLIHKTHGMKKDPT